MAKHPLLHKWHNTIKHNTTFDSYESFRDWCFANGWVDGNYVKRRFSALPFNEENTVILKKEADKQKSFNGYRLVGQTKGNLKITRLHDRYTSKKPVVWAYCSLCNQEKVIAMWWFYKQGNPNCGCTPNPLYSNNKKWTPGELQSVKDAIMEKPEQSVISVCREIAPQYGVSAEKVYATYNRMSKKGWRL